MIVRPYQSLLIVNNADSRTPEGAILHAYTEPVGKVKAKPGSEILLRNEVAKKAVVHF